MIAQNTIAELAYTAAEIAQYVFIAAGDNFDAAGVATVGAANRKGQCAVDKVVNRLRRVEGPAARREQYIPDLAAYRRFLQRRRQRTPSAPEAHAQWCVRIRREAIAPIGWLRRRWPVPGRARLLDRREDWDQMREPADRKDLLHHCVEASHAEPPVLRFPARGGHQSLQSTARNIFDTGKVDDDILGIGTDGGEQ